jgi:hypothetical protein
VTRSYWTPLGRALHVPLDSPLIELDQNRHPVAVLRFGPGDPPGVLIVGTSGGGKTNLIRFGLINVVRDIALPKSLWLGDGKGADSLRFLQGQPGVVRIVTKPLSTDDGDEDPVVTLIRDFHDEVRLRYSEFAAAKVVAMDRDGGVLDYEPPELMILVLDEYMDWVMGLGTDLRNEMQKRLAQIGQVGREVNARFWIATQAPYAKTVGNAGLPPLLKLQLGQRIGATGDMGMRFNEGQIGFDDQHIHERIEEAGNRAGLIGRQRKGLGVIQVAQREIFFKTPRTPDPLHWETSAEDAQALWKLLPYRPPRTEIREMIAVHERRLRLVE